MSLDREMSATIPGEVSFLQYVVGPDGHDQQVFFRPFGSRGIGPSIDAGAGPMPGRAGAPELGGATIRPFRAFRPHPGEGPFFHPPIALPSGPHRDRWSACRLDLDAPAARACESLAEIANRHEPPGEHQEPGKACFSFQCSRGFARHLDRVIT